MQTTLTPAYIPILQKPKCCAVACLQMILYRRGFGLFDQEDLAVEFGVKIGADDKAAFRADMPIMTSFNFDEGISTLESIDQMNAFFQKRGIGLRAEAFRYSAIASVTDLIVENLQQNKDVWVEYHSKEIYEGDPTSNRIHDALIESIDRATDTVMLIDPKPNRKQRVRVLLHVLERALSSELGKELGIVIVSPAKE